jgi:conjugal transfer/type IV secretion protein DotA/TraY
VKQLLRLTIGLSLGLLFATASFASVPASETAYATGGFGKWIIDSLFDAGTITDQAGGAGIVGATITPLSLMCMIAAAIIIGMKSIQHLLIVAQAKDLDQSPVAMTWAPLHMVIAVVLMVPLPSGYSMGQYGAIWLGHQSNTLGNLTASKSTDFFRNNGAISPPSLPSAHAMVDGVVTSQMCAYLNNQTADFVEDNGGVPIRITPRTMNASELASIGGSETQGGLTRAGVTFGRVREGGFYGGSNIVDDYCGAISVQYTSSAESILSADSIGDVDPESCSFGPLCMGKDDVTRTSIKNTAINVFSAAHRDASSAFLSAATGSDGKKIAQTLLYDMPAYFDAKESTSSAQAYSQGLKDEPAKIDEAVTLAYSMIGGMQADIYSSYASALDQFGTVRNGSSGENFLDTVDRVGWPVLGLYWFQFTNFSQSVMDSVSVQSIYTGDINSFIDTFALMVDDPEIAFLLKNRVTNYKAALARKIQNTRYDSTPGSTGVSSYSQNASFAAAESALEIREAFPLMREEMLANAYKGGMNPTSVMESMTQSLNTFTRSLIFPHIIQPLQEDNLVNGLVNTGHNIIAISEIIYVGSVVLRTIDKRKLRKNAGKTEKKGIIARAFSFFSGPIGVVINAIGFVIDAMIIVFQDFAELWFYVFLMGLFLAFYLPAMIMIQWLIGMVTWIIYIVEATIIIPLWGLLFTADMGQKSFAPQTAQQGFVHMLSILVYPSLMIIGFVIGLKVIDLISTFLVEYLFIGLLNSTDGYVFGLLSLVAGLMILGLACYQIIVRVFSLVLELNDRAMSWIGNRQGYGESQSEGQVRGGVNAVIGKIEMGSKRPGKK